MAAPQRRYRGPAPAGPAPARPVERRAPARLPGPAARRKRAGRRRRFALLVVVPVLLMLGSVYLHTVAAGLDARVAYLEERLARASAEEERLGVRVAELSGADRIRPLAEEKLGMRQPGIVALETNVTEGEDGAQIGGEAERGESR